MEIQPRSPEETARQNRVNDIMAEINEFIAEKAFDLGMVGGHRLVRVDINRYQGYPDYGLRSRSLTACSLVFLAPDDGSEPPLTAKQLIRGRQDTLYTCEGKGGAYVYLGHAKPAGTVKTVQGDSSVAVYRDIETGQLYFRDPADFNRRMTPINDQGETV